MCNTIKDLGLFIQGFHIEDSEVYMEGYLSKKSIHINESFVHAIALALW